MAILKMVEALEARDGAHRDSHLHHQHDGPLALRRHRRADQREGRLLRRCRARWRAPPACLRICAAPRPTRPTPRWSSTCRCSRPATCAPACWSALLKSWRAARFFARRSAKLPPGEIACRRREVRLHHRNGHQPRRSAARRSHVLASPGKRVPEIPARVHVRTPTFAVMPAIRWMVMGARLADTPLIQASIDPCYSCTDR